MRTSTIIAALAAPLGAFASAQVNFYYDTKCKNYAGTSFADLNRDVVGGPAGSRSMLFVSSDQCFDTCGPNLYFCKNKECNAYDLASRFGECKTFRNGVWAAQDCGCL